MASDEVRRRLNQAFFTRICVVNDEFVGDELSSPLVELRAAERDWMVLQAEKSLETALNAAKAEKARRSPETGEKATPRGDLFFRTGGDLSLTPYGARGGS